MYVYIQSSLFISLFFTLSIAVTGHLPIDHSMINWITTIQDAFCQQTWRCSTTNPNNMESTNDSFNFTTDTNFTLENLLVEPPNTYLGGCCVQCRCYVDCVQTDSCCIQMLGKIPHSTTVTSCTRPQLRPFSNNYNSAFRSYLMLSGCSATREDLAMNDPARMMCENPEDFDSLDVKIPVTDIHIGLTYINRYCAYCNGRIDRDIEYWTSEVSCKNDSLPMSTTDTILADVVKTNTCNIIYYIPPTGRKRTRRCQHFISSCNVTGHWTNYDSLIEQACAAYTSPYNNKYKNVFCFLCNTDRDVGFDVCAAKEGDPGSIVPLAKLSFSALLRFRPNEDYIIGPLPGELIVCMDNQIYDGYNEVCKNITCYPPRRYQNNTCISPFQTISGVRYRFYIKLKPVQELDLRMTGSSLPADIISATGQWKAQHPFLPRESESYRLFVKQSNGDQVNIEYLLLQVDIDIPVNSKIKTTLVDNILSQDNTILSTTCGLLKEQYDFHTSFVIAELSRVNGHSPNDTKEDGLLVHDMILGETLTELGAAKPLNDPEKDGDKRVNDIKSGANGGNAGDDAKAVSDDDITDIKENPGKNDDSEEDIKGDNGENDSDERSNKDDEKSKYVPPLEIMSLPKVCPLVELSIAELEIEWFSWGIRIKDLNKDISRAKYIEILDHARQNITMFVCKSLFQDITNALMIKYPRWDNRKRVQDSVPQGMLSLICTCLSVFCSLLTLTTYVLFKELRTQPGINNMMLTISLICAQILFQFGASQAENVTELGCKIIGVLVHFSWLMTIMWMNVCSLHMFRVFNSLRQKTTGTSIVKTTFVYTGYCIFISTIPVVVTIVVSVTEYEELGYGGHICYISHYDMVGFTFALPVGVIIFMNFSLFSYVIVIITKLPKLDGSSTKNRNFAKIYIKLSTLTGLTWLFGFVFAFTGIEALEYIFIVLNAGIGVFIFLAFVCNQRVLQLFSHLLQPRKTSYSESTRRSGLSESPSLETKNVQSQNTIR